MNNLLDVLVAFYNYNKKKDIDYKITEYLIKNFEHIELIEQKKVASICQTSVGHLHKYAQLFGYNTFQDLKKDLIFHKEVKIKQVTKRIGNTDTQRLYSIYKASFGLDVCINQTDLFLELKNIADLIKKSNRIFVYGAVYPRAILMNTCVDLILKGKFIENYEQLTSVERQSLTEEDLIIVISYTGSFITLKTKPFMELNQLPCRKIIISQYANLLEESNSYQLIKLPYTVDNHELNYVLLSIFDLIKYFYFQ